MEGLALAAWCAQEHSSQLVVIRSGAARGAVFPRELAARGPHPTLVIDLPDQVRDLVPGWRSDVHPIASRHRGSDVGLKRNLGLLLGQLCGWQALLMLDDDISTRRASQLPARADVERTDPTLRLPDVLADFAEYPQIRAAGYQQKDFDDNSVLCHARRLLGRPQEGFISGGAVVVRCGSGLPFFPAVYNEDWLFFFMLMLRARHTHPSGAIRSAGVVHQSAYHPFSAARARSEELGDVLAEGLFALLDDGAAGVASSACSARYWEEAVWQRQMMINELLADLYRRQPHWRPGLLSEVQESLTAAQSVYQPSVPRVAAELADYVRHLLADQDAWEDLLDGLRPASSSDVLPLEQALEVLGFAGQVTRVEPSAGRSLALVAGRRGTGAA